MGDMNKTVLMGRLGRDPDLRTSASGVPWCSFSLATSRRQRDGDKWTEVTDWHEVRVFRGQAETSHEYLRKGSPVLIEGSIQYEKWTDDDGKPRTAARIIADRVVFVPTLSAAPAQAA